MGSLKNINVWYGHTYVFTLVLDLPMPEGSENMAPVVRRGWCAALSLSALPWRLALSLALSCSLLFLAKA